MTSKNLFFRLVRQDFRKRIWYSILVFIALFLFLEVNLLMGIEHLLRYPHLFGYDLVTYVRDYFFGVEAYYVTVTVCGAAFVCALSGYAYLHSRKQLDTYHSLPVSRTQLFWSRFVSGILQFLIPFVLHVLACAGIAAGRDAFTMETAVSMLSYVGMQTVVFVLSYSATVVAVELTGNIIISIMAAAVLFGYSTSISVLAAVLFSRFFDTYIVYGNVLLCEKVWCFSPLSMILKLYSDPADTLVTENTKLFKYNTSYLLVLLVAALLYSLAAYVIYLKRASEAAGKSIAFRTAEPVVKTMIVVPASFFAALFFSEFTYRNSADSKWFLFGLIFGFVIISIVLEGIFRMDIRSALKHKRQLLFNAACTALIFIVIKNDVTGYNTYVPSDSQLQSCAVSIGRLMPLAQNMILPDGSRIYVDSDKYRMKTMEIQGNPSVMELARKAAKEKLAYQVFDYYEGIETSDEYVRAMEREESYREISYGYKLLNGRTIYRKYVIDIADADTLRLLADVFNDYDYKMGAVPLFRNGWNVEYDAVLCRSNFLYHTMPLTPQLQSELIETYQSEYTKLTLDTVMNTIPVGMIEFVGGGERVGSYTNYNTYTGEMFVYPQFTGTIALLRENGFDMEERLTAEEVDSITVTENYTVDGSYQYIGSYGYSPAFAVKSTSEPRETRYTDKEQIQQILDNVISDGFSWSVSSYAEFFDYQYSVNIRSGKEEFSETFLRFIEGRVPDFIE